MRRVSQPERGGVGVAQLNGTAVISFAGERTTLSIHGGLAEHVVLDVG